MSDVGQLLLASALDARLGDVKRRTEVDVITQTLTAVRQHLQMDVAYLSEFVDGRSVFRAVDAPGWEHLIQPGDSMALDDIYCQHILEGRLPQVIPDTSREAVAAALPITSAAPIGSHVSVPLHREDGTPYGMFCCLSAKPHLTLNDRDVAILTLYSDLAGREINTNLLKRMEIEALNSRIDTCLAPDGFAVHYQPIFELGATRPSGFEALCRFAAEPYRSPDIWFGEAVRVERQIELEVAVIRRALDALEQLPHDICVSVNASPETIMSGKLGAAMEGFDPERIVLELTEHAAIRDYDELERALNNLRYPGMKLAIDDTGAGFSGLQHILRLRPDILKLDMTLTRDVDSDFARRSLCKALVHFAAETRAVIVAEGIETAAERDALLALGIQRGQGYFLGRPADLTTALDWFACGEKQAVA